MKLGTAIVLECQSRPIYIFLQVMMETKRNQKKIRKKVQLRLLVHLLQLKLPQFQAPRPPLQKLLKMSPLKMCLRTITLIR